MPPRILEVRKNILRKNDELARGLREEFARAGVYVVNLVSAPGSGKTALLELTLRRLRESWSPAALTGDLATENDARRLAASGAPARQILTGTMCHLEAKMVSGALDGWDVAALDFLFIENVGNLVCPSGWDLGEDLRVLLMSVTEGEDKPLKYPTLIHTADVVVLSKMDMAEAAGFDAALSERYIREARPDIPVLRTSARTGEGVGDWVSFLEERMRAKRAEGRG